MFFRAKECSQSFRRRSSVIVLRMSISFLSCASVWTWLTHKLLVSSVMLLIWIWAAKTFRGRREWDLLAASLQLTHKNTHLWPRANSSATDQLWCTCKSCIFVWWLLMSLLKVWLTALTVQLTSARFSFILFSVPAVSLRVKRQQMICLNTWSLYTALIVKHFAPYNWAPYQSVLVAKPRGGSGDLWGQAGYVPIGGAAQRGQPVVQLHQVALGLERVSLDGPELHLETLWQNNLKSD